MVYRLGAKVRLTIQNKASLLGVLEIMYECEGMIVLRIGQIMVKKSVERDRRIRGLFYLPAAWNHLEAGIGFALKVPILIICEGGVEGGVFDNWREKVGSTVSLTTRSSAVRQTELVDRAGVEVERAVADDGGVVDLDAGRRRGQRGLLPERVGARGLRAGAERRAPGRPSKTSTRTRPCTTVVGRREGDRRGGGGNGAVGEPGARPADLDAVGDGAGRLGPRRCRCRAGRRSRRRAPWRSRRRRRWRRSAGRGPSR